MACQVWSEKLDQYLDGELPSNEQQVLREHMRGCADCSSESLDRLRAKRAIQLAGQRFVADPAFCNRMQAGIQRELPHRDRPRPVGEGLLPWRLRLLRPC